MEHLWRAKDATTKALSVAYERYMPTKRVMVKIVIGGAIVYSGYVLRKRYLAFRAEVAAFENLKRGMAAGANGGDMPGLSAEEQKDDELDAMFEENIVICSTVSGAALAEMLRQLNARIDVDATKNLLRTSPKDQQYRLWNELIQQSVSRPLLMVFSSSLVYAISRVLFTISGRYACSSGSKSPQFIESNRRFLGFVTTIQEKLWDELSRIVPVVVKRFDNRLDYKSRCSGSQFLQILREIKDAIESCLTCEPGSGSKSLFQTILPRPTGNSQSKVLEEMLREARGIVSARSFSKSLAPAYESAFNTYAMAFYTELHPDWIPPRQYQNQGGIASFNSSPPSASGAANGESPLLEMTFSDEQRDAPTIPLPRLLRPILASYDKLSMPITPNGFDYEIVNSLAKVDSISRLCSVVFFPLGEDDRARRRAERARKINNRIQAQQQHLLQVEAPPTMQF